MHAKRPLADSARLVSLGNPAPRSVSPAGSVSLIELPAFAAMDMTDVLDWCVEAGTVLPRLGAGDTTGLWEFLATLAAVNVGVARMLEPHLDALSILDQAGRPDLSVLGVTEQSSWGVFAAEGGESRLDATEHATRWTLDGTKVWCSLAGELSHALVTAYVGGQQRGLFAINLSDDGVSVHEGPWTARGLQQIRSAPITLSHVPAIAIGSSNWYVERPGFQWGGMGVAACWWGGAIGVSRKLFTRLLESQSDPILAMHAGMVDVQLASSRTVLADAAHQIDRGAATAHDLALLAKRVRSQVFDSAEIIIRQTAHALGPAPLVTDEEHARRVADLDLYIRQHHAEKDSASLGRLIREGEEIPW